jgi:hypothetical protein
MKKRRLFDSLAVWVRLHDNLLLWSCLLVVSLFLIYFSIRMVNAIGKKDTHDRL